jgi:Trk K+ transport system NAD-binding subunit
MSANDRVETTSATVFLVCGLGSLGQYCVATLKEFGVTVCAIESVNQPHWDIPELPELLHRLVIGDCRQPKVLEQANIRQCRAVLLVTDQEQVNLEAAFAARSLNPSVRLVVRSAQENLNELLAQQLGNFVAFEPNQLPANAFALAALGGETRGFFALENQMLRVVTVAIGKGHRWSNSRCLHELNTSSRRLLLHEQQAVSGPEGFYQWEPDHRIQPGDTVTYLEISSGSLIPSVSPAPTRANPFWQWITRSMAGRNLQASLNQLWQSIQQNRTQQIALFSALIMFCLFVLGTLLYKMQYPELSLLGAMNVALILCFGGYSDVFGGVEAPPPVPWWLMSFSFGLTLAGTIFVGILYAILTERVLTLRFQFLSRRPPVPRQGHIIVVGMGQLGQRIATLLQSLKQPLVGMGSTTLDSGILPQMPLVEGNFTTSLDLVCLPTARSIVIVTDNEVTNLELGLMAHAANSDINLVIRTLDPLFARSVARLLPYARVLGAYALAAEVFAAAAFGENVLNLFRLGNQTTLVTEYLIEAGDTLQGLLLAEVAYGYGVVPVLHQRADQEVVLMPPDDGRLQAGDRLVVLATTSGLRQVEQGVPFAREWYVRVERVFSDDAAFEGGAAIARISGCEVSRARTLINNLPGTLEMPLYKHQALRLVRELSKLRVQAHLVNNGNRSNS